MFPSLFHCSSCFLLLLCFMFLVCSLCVLLCLSFCFICPIAIAYSMEQIIKSVCVRPSVCLSVCEHSHGRIFRSIFTKISTDVSTPRIIRTGSIDVVQECRSYFRVELPSCLIKKKKISFCLCITVWRICLVDIVVSCDLLCCCAAN